MDRGRAKWPAVDIAGAALVGNALVHVAFIPAWRTFYLLLALAVPLLTLLFRRLRPGRRQDRWLGAAELIQEVRDPTPQRRRGHRVMIRIEALFFAFGAIRVVASLAHTRWAWAAASLASSVFWLAMLQDECAPRTVATELEPE
jgi:hypothetical protein